MRLAISAGASVFTMHPDDPEFATEIEAVGESAVWMKGEVSTANDGSRLASCP